ncbi:MAG: hypothetical protein OEX03_07260 [Gammaproteobacteria bacterium]|nr:hypothetical protein [Gammaproteobacteria bacterium]
MKLLLKIILLVVIYFILFALASGLFATGTTPPMTAEQEAMAVPGMLVVALVHTLIIVQLIRMSALHGWRLSLVLMLGFYGVTTFMSQNESLWFAPALGIPYEVIPGFFLSHIPVVLIFMPLAVWLLGRWSGEELAPSFVLQMPVQEWVWKLALIALAYLVLYFSFGFLIAWQNPELQQMYNRPEGQWVFRQELLIPWQILRGVLWGLLAVVILRMLRGSFWSVAVMIGIYFALPMNIYHILPNPYMPIPGVRLSHFIETASSNFILGLVVCKILLWRKA